METLSALLARALRLDPAERHRLYVLAGRPPPDDRARAPEEVCEPLRRMLRQPGRPAVLCHRAALGQFRAYAGDSDFERLVAHLLGTSAEFREWWPRHEVLPHLSGRKRVRHPVAGAMVFEHTALRFDDGTDRRMVVFVPLAEADTMAKLAHLLAPKAAAAE